MRPKLKWRSTSLRNWAERHCGFESLRAHHLCGRGLVWFRASRCQREYFASSNLADHTSFQELRDARAFNVVGLITQRRKASWVRIPLPLPFRPVSSDAKSNALLKRRSPAFNRHRPPAFQIVARLAKLADALRLGRSVLTDVWIQLLHRAPTLRGRHSKRIGASVLTSAMSVRFTPPLPYCSRSSDG